MDITLLIRHATTWLVYTPGHGPTHLLHERREAGVAAVERLEVVDQVTQQVAPW